MSWRLPSLALAAAVFLVSPRANAASDSLDFNLLGAGGTAQCTATGTCVCPTTPQMICTGTTCTLFGDVTCDTGTDGDITVESGVTLNVTPWSSAAPTQGVLNLHAPNGTITIAAGAIIDGDGAGYTGSAGAACTGAACVCTDTPGQSGVGFGPGGGIGGQCIQDGAGGGGYGGMGGAGSSDTNCGVENPPANGGAPYDPNPTTVTLGSAGGAAGSADNDNGGTGPSGGGAISLFGQTLVIDGIIESRGGDGLVVANDSQGGGAGGGILLNASAGLTCGGTNSLDVRGGNGASIDDKGGAGGGGRIKLFAVAVTGTCNYQLAAGSSGCSGGSGTAAVVTSGQIAAPTITSPPDGSTVAAQPTIFGTLPASVCSLGTPTVEIDIGATPQGTTTVNCSTSPGTWSFTFAVALAPGTYAVSANATVTVNGSPFHSQQSNTVNITVVGVGFPTIDISTPAPSLYTNVALPTVAGIETGAPAPRTVTVTLTQGASVTTSTTDATGATSPHPWTDAVNYTPPAQGPVTITASVTSAAGTATDTRTYVYDTEPPNLTVVPSPTLGNVASVGISGSYGDATSGIQPGTLTLQICQGACPSTTSCVTVAATATSTGYTATVGSPPLAAGSGTYCANASVEDLAGNTGTASATFSVDQTPPVITINGAPTLTQSGDSVSGTETDDNPGPVTVTYCSESCATLGTNPCPAADIAGQVTVAPSAGAFTASPTPLPDGTYCVEASATDAAGNTGTTTATLVIDSTVPTVLVDPSIGATTTPTTVCIAASDANGIASVDVTYTVNGVSQGSLTATAAACTMTDGTPGQYTVTVPGVPGDTTVSVTATATATTGTVSPPSTGTFLSVNSGPVVVLTTPSDPTNAASPIIEGSATSPVAIASVTMTLYAGGSCGGTPLATDDVTGSASGFAVSPWPTTPLPAGTYCVQVVATDKFGNTTTQTLVITEDPTVPTITVDVSPDPTTTATPTATGTDSTGVSTVHVVFSAQNADGSCSSTAISAGDAPASSGDYSFTSGTALTNPPGVACAPYCVSASGTDANGNSATAFARFDFCTTATTSNAPMSLTATDDGSGGVAASGQAPSSASSVNVVITSTDANGNCTLNQVATGTATVSGGTWSVDTGTNLPPGTYCVTATAESGTGPLASADGRVTLAAPTTTSTSTSGSTGTSASTSSSTGTASSSSSGSGSSGSASTTSSTSSSTSSTSASSSGSSGSGSSSSGSSGSSSNGGTVGGGTASGGTTASDAGSVAGAGCNCGTGPAPADASFLALGLALLAARRKKR